MRNLNLGSHTWVRSVVIFVLFALFTAGCGGGGGGPPQPTVVTLLARLQAFMEARQEAHVVVDFADAHAVAIIDLMSDGTVHFSLTVEERWRGDVQAAHIHRGAPGVPGGIEISLDVAGVPDDGTEWDGTTVQASTVGCSRYAAWSLSLCGRLSQQGSSFPLWSTP